MIRNQGIEMATRSESRQKTAIQELKLTRADLGRLGGLFRGWLGGAFEKGTPGPNTRAEIRRLLDDIEKAEALVITSVKKLIADR